MVLELHTWGPAFGLPSIDAQCLATICYLRKCLPHNTWSLIPSSEPSISPLGELPALRDDNTWVAGFSNIVTYLRDVSDGEWDLDKALDEIQRADCAALSSFIDSRGQPLLDLSLYVSSDNYLNCTKQALASVLTWPNSWTIPHELRARAKRRSEHLGLSSLDVDMAQDDNGEDAGLTAHIPKSLRKPKQTVTGLLGRNMQKNKFRLDAATSDFFEPVMEMLDEKQWLLGEEQSSTDCLTIGYLALMQMPELPHNWVKGTLRAKYPRLEQWVQTQVTETFGSPVDVAVVLGRKPEVNSVESCLPWRVLPERTLQQVLHSILDGCISSIPMVGRLYSVSEVGAGVAADHTRYREKQVRLANLQRRREVYIQVIASTCAITGLVGWMIYKGMVHFPHRPAVPKGRNFGEAGALLGLV